jgi:excisionase family DNA binding protein
MLCHNLRINITSSDIGENMQEVTETQAEHLPAVLTVEEVGQWLKVSRNTAYDLAHRHGFPVLRIGRTMRVPRDAFLRWLNEQTGVQEG